MLRAIIVFAVAIAALFALQVAFGAEVTQDVLRNVNVPGELWYVLIGGAVQGLIWYGAVNSKITSLTERITQIEQRAAEDRKANEIRANNDRNAQNHHYAELLKVFIQTLQERK